MKKALIITGLLSSAAIASQNPYAGLYIGGFGGANYVKGTHDYKSAENASVSQDLTKVGGLFGLHAGYKFPFMGSNNLLGFEFYGYGATGQGKTDLKLDNINNREGVVTLKPRYGFGVLGTWTIPMNVKFCTQLKAGFELSKAKMTYTFENVARTNETKNPLLKGFVAGIGIGYRINKNLLLNADVEGVFNLKQTLNDLEKDKTTADADKRGYSMSLKQFRGLLRLNYLLGK